MGLPYLVAPRDSHHALIVAEAGGTSSGREPVAPQAGVPLMTVTTMSPVTPGGSLHPRGLRAADMVSPPARTKVA